MYESLVPLPLLTLKTPSLLYGNSARLLQIQSIWNPQRSPGFIAALGVGLQGVALLEPDLSLQTLAHLGGALAFFYGAWCHMGAAQKLYLPTVPAEDRPDGGFDSQGIGRH